MRALLILVFAVLMTGPAMAFADPAQGVASGTPNAANTPDDAVKTPDGKFVQSLGDHAISEITDANLTPDQRVEKYRQLLRDSFDLKTIGHFVIGRAWNNASDQQRDEYMKLFEQIVVKTYGDRLNLYAGEGFRVKSVRPESDRDAIVGSEITHADGSAPAKIDWRVRLQDGKPEVIDVVVEGVSQSITQRDEYEAIIQRDGGKLDGLLDLMRKQVQEQQAAQ